MGYRIGAGYIGSSSILTSTENLEVIPAKYNFYKFQFMNDQECQVKVNKDNPIVLRAGQGFQMDQIDSPIHSFIIVDAGITYNWIGAYS